MLNFKKDAWVSGCMVHVLGCALNFCWAIFVTSLIFSSSGKYELVPQYKGENTVFDVSPSVMPISVEHQHVTVPKKFQVR